MNMHEIRSLIPIPSSQVDEDIRHFFKGERRRELNMDPDYQRGHVWSPDQQVAFVGYFLSGGPVPNIWIQRYDSVRTGGRLYVDKAMEVLDGKQRLTALQAWMDGKIPARLVNGEVIWAADLSAVDWRFCRGIKINYVDLTRAEQLALYVNLNAGGTPHSPDEIARVEAMIQELDV
jgi:hypothetical protein